MAIFPVLISVVLNTSAGAQGPAPDVLPQQEDGAPTSASGDQDAPPDRSGETEEEPSKPAVPPNTTTGTTPTRPQSTEPTPTRDDEGHAFEAQRDAVERRFQTGLTPAQVKGLWCGLQLGAMTGDFQGVSTGGDFMYYAGSLTSFQLGFMAGLSDHVGLEIQMRMAKTGAMFHNTTGIEAGVRMAPFGDGARGIPVTIGARAGVSAIPGFLGPAWQEDIFSAESIYPPSALGSLRLDVKAPIAVRSDRVWYFLGETAMAFDVVKREVYHADMSVDVSKRPNVYSGEFLGGVGTGWAIPGKHLNVHVEVLGGALTWPSGLGEPGGATPVGFLRLAIQGLSADDLKRVTKDAG